MEFEWDPAKDAINTAKHGFDFTTAGRVFDDPFHYVEESPRSGIDELRWKAVGRVDEPVIAVIFTVRQGRHRIISARRARSNERREYDRRATRTGRDDRSGHA
jgi:uncharacterized protein